MRLVVQKYGGTSVGTPKRIRKVARRLLKTQSEGCQVVAVISAMAGATDNLLKLAHQISSHPTERELDMLLSTGEHAAAALTAMAVNALGGRAASLTGAQAGILTDRNYTKARIANISPKQIHELLSDEPGEFSNPGVKPIERGSGGGGIRTHGGYSPHTISSRAH